MDLKHVKSHVKVPYW